VTHRWHTGTVASGGEDIYYEVTGDDIRGTFLLTHGAGGSHAAWYQQVPAFADAGYRVVTWDCRGFGNSTFTSGAHGTDAAVADMDAVLADLGASRVHLVGQSMGGWWVVGFTLAHPERVASLTMSNTVAGLWTDALNEHFVGYVRTAADAEEQQLGRHNALSPRLVERDPARAFLYQQLNTFHTPPMAEVVGALMQTRVAHADLDALDIPMLVITGTDDDLFPAKLITESAGMMRNATLVEIADAGHSPYFERPDEYNRAVLEFVAPHAAH
jgi:pimeloyl-ACP methyl ester carboxylesterase